MDEVVVYLGLGSNVGDRLENMRSAVRMIDEHEACRVQKVSSLYETAPVGFIEQPDFLNAVIEVVTSLDPRKFLRLCSHIEKSLGRKRTIRWGPRVIDIDILIYDNTAITSEELIIPHPRIKSRAFVLVPLAEIAPYAMVDESTTAETAASRIDDSDVRRIADESWVN